MHQLKEKELQWLYHELEEKNNKMVFVSCLTGMGSVGLTQLYIERYGDKYSSVITWNALRQREFPFNIVDDLLLVLYNVGEKDKNLLVRLQNSEKDIKVIVVSNSGPFTTFTEGFPHLQLKTEKAPELPFDLVVNRPDGERVYIEVMRRREHEERFARTTQIYHLIDALELKNIDSTFCEKLIKDDKSNIVLPDKKIALPSDLNIRVPISEINEQLMHYIAEHPEAMRELTSREFEEMVARLFQKMGFEVELTKQTKDGGKDIYIARNDVWGKLLYLVECKRNGPERPVGVEVIRELYGVLGMDERKPTGGIIATTSYFSRDVKREIVDKRMENRIALHDYDYIAELMKKVYG